MGLGKSSELFVIFISSVLKRPEGFNKIFLQLYFVVSLITESSGCVKIQKYKQEEKGGVKGKKLSYGRL